MSVAELIKADELSRDTMHWIKKRPVTLDFGGPEEVAYERMPTNPEEVMGVGLMERAARLYPNKVAISDGVTTLTYAEMMDRIYGLAARIAEAVEPGGVIAAVVHNSTLAPVVMGAATASGRILIPIDAGHPIERQTALFAETGASAVIVAEGVEIDDSFIPASTKRISVDITKVTGAVPVRRNIDPDAPLMVMFTSGSTGRPKGLAVGLSSGGRSVANFVDKFHINPDDVIVGLASLSQGGAADVIALLTGATLRIVDMKRKGIIEALRVMGDEGITVLSFVPSVLRTLMALPGIERALSSLRILDLHGERILASDIALFRSKLPKSCHISVTYGSTEAGAVFSWFVQDDMVDGAVVPIGYLAGDKQVALVREDGSNAAPGEVGELIVRGEMALGSWQGGRVTSNRFVIDPADPRSRIYAMGDQVRMREDGLFEFVGRRDRQVKIRGLWVDLGEIESALRQAEGVVDTVVIAHSKSGEPDSLVAFITVEDAAAPPKLAALRTSVATATAEHMTPAQIHILPVIPRLANYKPDLVRLSRMAAEGV